MVRTYVLAVSIAALAASGLSAEKAPWLWTDAERARERVQPQERQQRRTEQLATGNIRRVAEGFSPIDGRTHPELFFPSELMDQFLTTFEVRPSEVTHEREAYRSAIVAQGWDYDKFWEEMNRIALPYVNVHRQLVTLRTQMHAQAEKDPQWSVLGWQLCRESTAVLKAARASFGPLQLDRFLYTAVAPFVHRWVRDTADDKAVEKAMTGGCN